MPRLRDLGDAIGSPYLQQHADNPVDWYTFDDDAFARAEELGLPVFISIGYSACHWCHVMAHESFEDPSVAAYLNAHFVAIKVDREERPDIDAIYMEAVHALGQQGGWPLSVFTTPAGRPFFGGTYFPPTALPSRPSFSGLLEAITNAWSTERETLQSQADELTDAVTQRLAPPDAEGATRPHVAQLIATAVTRFTEMFDPEFGGVGTAPKFPQGPMLELLLRAQLRGDDRVLPMIETSLAAMAAGGIYDHLGGGFARYSVDRRWLVPHFEKMLYDQATLARLYLHAGVATGDQRWYQVAHETIEYVLRDLRAPSGGLYSAEDADSEGEEGLFYTWTRAEIIAALGEEDAATIFAWYGELDPPNFEGGRSILTRPLHAPLARPLEVEALRSRLLAVRSERARPARDEKVLTEWNAMFASMLCEAAAATENIIWRSAAEEIAAFIDREMVRSDGRLLRSWREGRAQHLAMATDYAWSVDLFTRLNELTGRASYLTRAGELATAMVALFGAEGGGWYLNGSDEEGLILRPIDSYDGVTPAAGSICASALARLGALTGDRAFRDRAAATIDAATAGLNASPIAFAHLVGAAALVDEGAIEIVVGPGAEPLLPVIRRRYLPDAVLAWGEATDSPLFLERNEAKVYLCLHGNCRLPVADAASLGSEIDLVLSR